MITNEHIEQFIAQAHRYGDAKLMLCSSGNLSWRIGEEALISGTGSWVPTGKLSLECFDTFKARISSNSPAAKSQSLIQKDWKHSKGHKTVFL